MGTFSNEVKLAKTRASIKPKSASGSPFCICFFTAEDGFAILDNKNAFIIDSMVTAPTIQRGSTGADVIIGGYGFSNLDISLSVLGYSSHIKWNSSLSVREMTIDPVTNESTFSTVTAVLDMPLYLSEFCVTPDRYTRYAQSFGVEIEGVSVDDFIDSEDGRLASLVWANQDSTITTGESYKEWLNEKYFGADCMAAPDSPRALKNVEFLAKAADVAAISSRLLAVEAVGTSNPLVAQVKSASFRADRDNTAYVIKAQGGPVGATTPVGSLYKYKSTITAGGSGDNGGNPLTVFRNPPLGSNPAFYGNGWSGNTADVKPFRIIVDLAEAVKILGLEYQGNIGTGYPSVSSGPRAVTFRFSNVPFSPLYNSGTGNLANVAKEWPNQWAAGSNKTSFSGLGELFDLRPILGANGVTARYMAIDVATSWDMKNSAMSSVLIHTVPDSSPPVTVDVDPAVKSFQIIDGNNAFAIGQRVDVMLGVDSVRLTESGTYNFVKSIADKRWFCMRNGTAFAEGTGL